MGEIKSGVAATTVVVVIRMRSVSSTWKSQKNSRMEDGRKCVACTIALRNYSNEECHQQKSSSKRKDNPTVFYGKNSENMKPMM